MRYIRVIDDLGDEYLTTYKEHCENVAELQDCGFDFEGCIIKQADTIPELCDELIIKNPNNDGDFYRKVFVYEGAWKNILNEKYAKHCTNIDIYKHDVEIFGAIWTYDSNDAPTLKAVAKMNEKGELELL